VNQAAVMRFGTLVVESLRQGCKMYKNWHELIPLNDEDFDKLPEINGYPVYINYRDGVIRVWPRLCVPDLKFGWHQ